MSDAHNEHESAIKTPKQLIVAIVAAFLVPIICIVLLVEYVTGDPKTGAGSDGQTKEAINARVAPVADQNFKLVDANAPKQLQSGEDVFKGTCTTCHATGALGAPKVADKAAWASRIAQGYDTLLSHALKGFKSMPAKGGNADLDDVEVGRAIVYMANQSGASFKEPAAPAAPAASAAASASASAAASAPAASAPAASTPAVAAAPAPAASAGAAASAPATAAADPGKKLFESTCTTCHTAGIAGAPKFGDKAAWAPRIAQGKPTLYDHALHGFKGMPPKGTAMTASDADVKAAVDYMVSAAK
jgi:cytochrome c5